MAGALRAKPVGRVEPALRLRNAPSSFRWRVHWEQRHFDEHLRTEREEPRRSRIKAGSMANQCRSGETSRGQVGKDAGAGKDAPCPIFQPLPGGPGNQSEANR